MQNCTKESFPFLREFVHSRHVLYSAFSEASRQSQEEDCVSGADFPDLHDWESFERLSLYSIFVSSDGADGKPLLQGCIGLRRGEDKGSVHLSYLFIEKSSQSQGLGTKLLRHALEWASHNDTEKVKVLTLEGVYSTAVRLYEKFGFEMTLRVEPSPSGCPHYTLLYMELRSPFLLSLSPIRSRPANAGGGLSAGAPRIWAERMGVFQSVQATAGEKTEGAEGVLPNRPPFNPTGHGKS